MDEAYLIIRNTNYSENISVLLNVVACENCDFENIANVAPGLNMTRIISTTFPYNVLIQANLSKKIFQCPITWYNFDEHGTYILEVIETDQLNGDACSITQIGEASYYWMPAIVGIAFFIVVIVCIQLWQYKYLSQYFNHVFSNIDHQHLIKNNLENTSPSMSSLNSQKNSEVDSYTARITINVSESPPLVESSRPSSSSNLTKKMLPKRLQSLDTFRGYSLMMMIFVNYGGGGYWFFAHSIWHGLTMADVMFPWFAWMIGVSIVLSQRSLRSKAIRKRNIFFKICRRTIILFLLGMATQGGSGHLRDLRIFATLQRLASCYFFTAIIVLWLDGEDNQSNTSIGNDGYQPIHVELWNTIWKFWFQWLIVVLTTIAWVLIIFFVEVPGCPKGYMGPGGKHDHGKYGNCTGGAAGYVDRIILSGSHMYNDPTCKDVYHTQVPFDPEGQH
ncbi:unnamed protein product [Rotaria sp. Silwood2]|nr:unnamed protein product [Rotaria sp. Silwood2]CAF4076105.1 unnamed protein product [Rotaria sp. Silwood2]